MARQSAAWMPVGSPLIVSCGRLGGRVPFEVSARPRSRNVSRLSDGPARVGRSPRGRRREDMWGSAGGMRGPQLQMPRLAGLARTPPTGVDAGLCRRAVATRSVDGALGTSRRTVRCAGDAAGEGIGAREEAAPGYRADPAGTDGPFRRRARVGQRVADIVGAPRRARRPPTSRRPRDRRAPVR